MKKNKFISAIVHISCSIVLTLTAKGQVIDLSKPVGTPDGGGQVSGSGASNYSVPIKTLPGVGGINPRISVDYNSGGNDGATVGYGWNLSCLSYIKRDGKSNYFNGTNNPINYTNSNDAFILDGQRMFAISGNNGANGTVYGLENEQFSKIESFGGSETQGPDWFKVTLKDGTVMEYGSTTAAKMPTDNGNSTMMWFLNKVTDINGNYEIFSYYISSGSDRAFSLNDITYGGNSNTGTPVSSKVHFTYGVKNDWVNTVKYEGGASLRYPYYLTNISVQNASGTQARSYDFSYTTVREKYLLQSVTEKGSDGTALNPLTFTYGSNTSASDVVVSTYRYPLTTGGCYAGDFNGDVKQDVMSLYYSIDNNGVRHDQSYGIYTDFSSYNGQPGMAALSYSVTSSAGQVNSSTNAYTDYLTNDFDGDGKEDVVIMNASTSGSDIVFNNLQINYSRMFNSVSGFTSQNAVYSQIPTALGLTFKYVYRNGSSFGRYFIPGDFNGDGVQDYILILGTNSSNAFKAFFSSPKLGIFNQEIYNFGVSGTAGSTYYANSVASATQLLPIDFDGDGKQEILVVTATQSYVLSVYGVSAASGYNYAASVLYTTAAIQGQYPVYPGDFNGDGKADLLYRASYNSSTANWYILTSTGTSFIQSNYTWANRPYLPQDGGGSSHVINVADYDHDGKTDVWQSLDLSSTSNKHNLEYYHGTTFHLETYSTSGNSINGTVVSSTNAYGYPNAVVGDYNGDGKADMLSINGSSSGIFIYAKPFKEELFLTGATNGLGRQEQFAYSLLTNPGYSPSGKMYDRTWYYQYDQSSQIGQNPNVNTPGSLSINGNPFNVSLTPLYVVNRYSISNGVGGLRSKYYSYVDATFSKLRGFQGFGTVNCMDDATGVTSGTQSKFNTTLLLPHVWHQYTYLYPDTLSDTKLTDTLLALSPYSYLDKRFVTKVLSSISYDNIKGSASKTDNTYDNYGNVTVTTTKNGYLNGQTDVTPTETVTTTTNYGTHGTPYPASPDNVTVSKTRTGQSALSSTSAFTYDAKGNIATQTAFSGQPLAVTTSYTRDGFGNVTQKTVSASGVSTRTATIGYDNSGRFVTSKSQLGSGSNKTETYTYDALFGNVSQYVSSDGLVTKYFYDAFGNLARSTVSLGYDITQVTSWESATGRYSVTMTRPGGGSNVKTFYDVLSRVVRKESSGFNNATLASTIQYNAKGQVANETAPCYSSESPVTTTYQYDSYGQLTNKSNGAISMSYAYQKQSGGNYMATATNGANQSSSKTQDATGKIVAATDNGGTLNYTYNSQGQTLQVALNGTTLVTSIFDIYGNQTSLTDRNAGVTSYTYDAFGQLTNQTDPLGKVTTNTYDLFGRPLTRVGTEGTTSYTYWSDPSSGYSNDNITKIVGFAGDTKEYTYDNNRKLSSQKITFDGSVFTTNYGYDSYGNPTQVTYPNGIVISKGFDRNGILMQVSKVAGSTSTVLFTATAMNSLGKYTAYSYGNGKSSTESYNLQTGMPTQFLTAGIQNMTFAFDALTGNLNQRKDVLKSLQEDFTYDNLNRLTSCKVNNNVQLAIAYDGQNGSSLGNIVSKTDAGNYTYSTSKVNAVAYITNPAGATTPPQVIPTTEQDILYTAFQKTQRVSDNNYTLDYTYGSDYQRLKSVLAQNGSTIETKYYIGEYEKQTRNGTTNDIVYVSGGNGLCAILVGNAVYYTYGDYLGSILTVTDATGNIVAQQNFDAWGRKRNPNDWTYSNVPTNPDWLYRGYTGHEHLNEFGLINMNGRMYDPVQGRMLGPDTYVPLPFSTQGYNRFSYANNNPLVFKDPDGNFWLVSAIVGFVSNYIVTGITTGNWGLKALANGLKGAVTGLIGYGIGSSVSSFAINALGMSTKAAALVGSAAGGLFSGGASSAMSGQNILIGAVSGLGGSLAGYGLSNVKMNNLLLDAGSNIAAGGITGGAISASMGGSFWSGFKAGALSSAVGWGVSKLAENYLDPQMQKKRADAQAKAEEILGVDKNEKANQLKSWNDVDNMVEATGHDGYDVQQQLKQLWVDTYGEDPGLISGNNFDFTSGGVLKVGELGNTLKFDNLHIRLEAGGGINYHYDYFNIMKTPLVHIMFDTIWQGVKFGKW